MRFAIIGTGFWARYQLGAWGEVAGATCVALCDRQREKAEALAGERGIPAVYDDAAAMLEREKPDFVDIITESADHAPCVRLAIERRVPAICQKPLTPTLAESEALVAEARNAGVPLFVHENWRWQTPLRQVKKVLDEGAIGKPFRARITMVSGFPVFINQPGLKEKEQFLIADMGVHILDTVRFLFGEAESLYCQLHRVHPDIRGEDVGTVLLKMRSGPTVLCEMGFPENYLERDPFPETFAFVEGTAGSLELAQDFWVRVTTEAGTHAKRYPPPSYPWANPDYAIAHSSMVPCNTNLLQGIRGDGQAETTAEDNLKTLRLVHAAYESARDDQVVKL
jgi:predicted dehydrogenase